MQLCNHFVKNWKWFGISVFAFLLVALIYLWFTPTKVNVMGKMQIIDRSKRSGQLSMGMSMLNSLPMGLGSSLGGSLGALGGGIESEEEILMSNNLSRDVVNELGLYTEYRLSSWGRKTLLYQNQPVNVTISPVDLKKLEDKLPLKLIQIKLTITKSGDNYTVETVVKENKENTKLPDQTFAKLPATIDTGYGTLVLSENPLLEDEDIDGGKELVKKVSAHYGDGLDESSYPEIKEKEGYYVLWDKENIDSLKTDEIVTASYIKYRTTISEGMSETEDGFYQSEVLVDGFFKEEDSLTLNHDLHYHISEYEKVTRIKDLVDYETITVSVPDDGQESHQIRVKPISEIAEQLKDFDVYLVKNDTETLLDKTGTLGDYSLYEVEGNDFTLNIKFNGAEKKIYLILAQIIGIILGILLVIVLIIIFIVRHGGKLPGILNKVFGKISQKIENKEQIFYDDSSDENDNDK